MNWTFRAAKIELRTLQTMGDLAVEFGFFGADETGGEGGESLQVLLFLSSLASLCSRCRLTVGSLWVGEET